MRVTLVVNRHEAPSETFQRNLATTLAIAGHQVTVHALRAGPMPAGTVPGVTLTEGLPARPRPAAVAARLVALARGGAVIDAGRRVRASGTGCPSARAVLQAALLLEGRPDVVHLGFSGIGVALLDVLPLLASTTLVVSCRGTDELVRPVLDPRRADALRALFAQVAAVHVVADAVGRAVVDLGAQPSQVHVIRPAVDLAAWSPAPRPPGPTHQLAAVGRLVSAKGYDDLLSAIAALRAAGNDIKLGVIGDGPHRAALRLRTARTGLDDVVELLGPGGHRDVAELLRTSQLFVSPSLSEGINNAVLEAMASGVPVVSTDVGGMAEVITHGVDGWLVPPGRPDRLAATVADVLADPAARKRVARAGRERVEASFTLERQVAQWRDFYERL